MKCPICGSETSELFRRPDHLVKGATPSYRLMWCNACEFGRLEGDFTPEQISTFYPKDYYTHHNDADASSVPPSFGTRLRQHLAWRVDHGVDFDPGEIADPPVKTACDLGCGAGKALRSFREAGYQPVGVEPDPAARAVASSAAPVFSGTAENLPDEVAQQKFGAVLMSHVLEHCIDPINAVRNAASLLEPGGTLVIEVPNNASVGFQKFGPTWPFTDIPRHLNFFTEKSLSTMITAAGLGISEIKHTGYFRQFTRDWLEQQEIIQSNVGGSRNFDIDAWVLLTQTAFSAPSRKYDSIRIHGRA